MNKKAPLCVTVDTVIELVNDLIEKYDYVLYPCLEWDEDGSDVNILKEVFKNINSQLKESFNQKE